MSGKISYVSDPRQFADCKPSGIKSVEPNPDEVERMLEEKKRKQDEERIADEAAREERLTRAREREAAAAERRAQAAEAELRLRRQQARSPAVIQPYSVWPYYPYSGVSPSRHHRGQQHFPAPAQQPVPQAPPPNRATLSPDRHAEPGTGRPMTGRR